MTLKDSVQTAILVVGFFSLLVFGASYYFVLIDPDSTNYPLKEALSITASFFGGFATLTAAYIASKLFNDWRDEKRYDLNKDLAIKALSTLLDFTKSYCYYLDELELENQDRDSKRFNIGHLYNLKNQFYDEYAIYISVNSKKSSREYDIPCKVALDECWRIADSYSNMPNPIDEAIDTSLREKLKDKSITDTIESLLEAIKVK